MFLRTFSGSDGCSQLVDCQTGCPEETRRGTKEGIRRCRAIALTSVMSKWYASCVMIRMEKEREPETWKRLHMGGVNKTSSAFGHQSFTKTLGMARGKISHVETRQRDSTNTVYGKLGHQDSLRRSEAEAYCEIMEGHDIHGWLISDLLRAMSGLEGEAMF